MTSSNKNNNLIKFYVKDPKQALSWYGLKPIHLDEEKAILDINGSFLVLIKQPQNSSQFLRNAYASP